MGLAEALAVAGAVDDEGQALFLNSPQLGFGCMATGIDPLTGELLAGRDPLPVVLMEPVRSVMVRGARSVQQELQVEAAVSGGLHRVPGPTARLLSCPDWSLHRLRDDRLELRSPDGGPFSRVRLRSADPSWTSSAVHHGQVLVMYGPQLGVRTPPGTAQGRYSAADRLLEVRRARHAGLVAGGLVDYHNNR